MFEYCLIFRLLFKSFSTEKTLARWNWSYAEKCHTVKV